MKKFLSFTIGVLVFASFAPAAQASMPVLSNVRAENIFHPGAQIMWNTDVPSDSKIFYGTSPGSLSSFSDSRCDSGGSVTGHCVNLMNLQAATTYYYKAKSGNIDGEGSSAELSFLSGGGSGGTAPTAPSNLGASVSVNNVSLSWADNSTDEFDFKIYRRPSGGSWAFVGGTNANATSFTDSGLAAGAYEYHVNACNNYGCSSDSNVATATVSASGGDTIPPSAITNLSLSSVTTNSVVLTWTAPGDDGTTGTASQYEIKQSTAGTITDSNWSSASHVAGSPPSPAQAGTTQTFTAFNLNADTRYWFAMKAFDEVSNYSFSNSPDVTTAAGGIPPPPPPPPPAAGAVLDGLVKDPAGNPLVGAGVHVWNEGFTLNFGASTDGTGSFFVNLPAGNYFVEFFPPQGRSDLVRPSPQQFSLLSGETKFITLQFVGATKTITGKVSFSSGEPITDAEVGAFSRETYQWTSAFVDGSGNYTLNVSGGKWMVGARPRDPMSARWSLREEFPEVQFVPDSAAETKTVNFVVPVSDATILVRTVDQRGLPFAEVGVVLDTVSASAPPSPTRVPPEFRKSDSKGLSGFSVRKGNYYLRAFLPSDRGYFNPDELSVSVGSGETKEVTLVFRDYALSTVSTVTLKGVTKLEDGTFTDAFVWGWSEKGQSVSGRSDSKGEFSFVVPPNDRLHIGAGKELGGFPYKAEVIVDTSNVSGPIELTLQRVTNVPLPPTVNVSQPATEQIVAQAQDGAKVTIPPSAVAPSGTVTVNLDATVEAPSQAAAEVVSTVYDVSVKDAAGRAVNQFTQDIEIILPYTEADLKKQGVTEDVLVPSYYDEATGAWIKIDNYTIDKENNVIIARVRHLTRFAIVAAADVTPPDAPSSVTVVNGAAGELLVSWRNPMKDFDHVKIYRSEERGILGMVVANDLRTATYRDGNELKNGKTYYYVARSVDPAGNESANINQVSAVAIGSSAAKKLPPGQAVKLQILRTLKAGSSGEEVRALQELLLKEGVYPEGLITGFFGDLTRQAVIRFQEKYIGEILAPAGLSSGTGIAGPQTLKKVNEFLGVPASEKPALPPGQVLKLQILRTLVVGATGDDVRALQELLVKEDIYPQGLITGFFGELTRQAVIRFQEKYASEILAPAGLTEGTGAVGQRTRAKLNQLLR